MRSALAFVVAATLSASPQDAATPNVRTLYAEGMAAYAAKDYPLYLRKMQEAAAVRPTHPTINYKLAGAHALNGHSAEAAAALEKLAGLSLFFDVGADADFAMVRDDARIERARAALDAVRRRRIGTSRVAWRIPDRQFIPEGIAYDTRSRSFLVSSQYQRKIVRVDASGKVQDFTTEGQDGLWMVFGIAVDAPRRLIWAVSTADKAMRGYTAADDRRAGLFAFNLDTGRLARKLAVDPATPAHYFDDVTVAQDGRVFLSDGGIGAIYTLRPAGEQLEMLVQPGTIQGPNGLALAADDRWLYVSDYAGFIFRVDPATGAASRLTAPTDVALFGIDGLARYANTLIGIQNGVEPARVVQLTLSADGASIARVTTMEMNNPDFGEPTLGVVVGSEYYYVANSNGGLLRRANGALDRQPLTEPVVLKLSLR